MQRLKPILLILSAIAVTLGALWFTNGAVTPRKVTLEDVRAEAQRGAYRLISTSEFWERYQANPEAMFAVDTRQAWEYRSGHIKGAVNFPMEPTWFSRWKKKGELETFLGPDKERTIVFY